MMTATNVIDNAWKIVLHNPELEPDITRRLLAVQNNTYINKGRPSPECLNIVLGNVLDCFSKYYPISQNQPLILDFARSQLENTRRSVAKRAAKLFKKEGISNTE